MQVTLRSRGFHIHDTCQITFKTIISGKILYLQLSIRPFADDRPKKIWNLPLCASEKEKYISQHQQVEMAQQILGGSAVIPDRKRWKAYTNDLGHLLLFIIVNLLGAFSRDFTTNLAPKCRAWRTSGLQKKL